MEDLILRKEISVYSELFYAIENNYTNYINNLIVSNQNIINNVDYNNVYTNSNSNNLDDVVEFLRILVENDKNLDKKVTSQNIFLSISNFSNYMPIKNYDIVLQICRSFIEKGFDINKKDERGRSVITLISTFSRVSQYTFIKMLLELGANFNNKDFFGDTILHKFIRHFSLVPQNNLEIIELMLSRGVDTKVINNNKDTPLLVCNSPSALKLLLSYGANPNDKDRNGETLLHKMIMNFLYLDYKIRVKIIKLLISYGANVNEKDDYLRTPLSMCNENSIRDILIIGNSHHSLCTMGLYDTKNN